MAAKTCKVMGPDFTDSFLRLVDDLSSLWATIYMQQIFSQVTTVNDDYSVFMIILVRSGAAARGTPRPGSAGRPRCGLAPGPTGRRTSASALAS